MAIEIHLDKLMVEKGINSKSLATQVGITPVNLSLLKTGKVKSIRFSTLIALCKALDCQPGDILTYREDPLEGLRKLLEK